MDSIYSQSASISATTASNRDAAPEQRHNNRQRECRLFKSRKLTRSHADDDDDDGGIGADETTVAEAGEPSGTAEQSDAIDAGGPLAEKAATDERTTSKFTRHNRHALTPLYIRSSPTSAALLLILTAILMLPFVKLPPTLAADAQQSLPVCARYQACAAEVGHFPLLSETVGQMIDVADEMDGAHGSGHADADGSGAGGGRLSELPVEDFPLYDEFVTSPPLFDYQTEAELTRTEICRCPQQDAASDGATPSCEFDETDGANVMRVDKAVRLAFCQPLVDLFKLKCGGRRGLLRIIGEVDAKTGESLASVNDTAVFCRCEPPAALRRLAVEPWLDKYAFVYQCTAP